MEEKLQPDGVANEELLADYIRHRKHDWPSEATVMARRQQLQMIGAKLRVSYVDATEGDLLKWRDSLDRAPETIAAYVSAVRGLYDYITLVRRLRPDNPSAILKRPRIPEAFPRPMPNRDFDLALACALRDPEMYLWLGMEGIMGLRSCEIAWLRVVDVTELDGGGGLMFFRGKGGKWRTMPIPVYIMMTLKPFLVGQGMVFTKLNGEPYKPRHVRYRVNRFLHGLGIAHTGHTLRHRFGTDYHELDPDIIRQARLMGHANPATTMRYTAVSPIEAARVVESLARKRLEKQRMLQKQQGRAHVA